MVSLLLKGGTLLVHGDSDNVSAKKLDLLIEGNSIAKMAEGISADSAEVIDCTGKIISPGFIDTHRHMWQTQTKGRGDDMIMKYIGYGAQFSLSLISSQKFCS